MARLGKFRPAKLNSEKELHKQTSAVLCHWFKIKRNIGIKLRKTKVEILTIPREICHAKQSKSAQLTRSWSLSELFRSVFSGPSSGGRASVSEIVTSRGLSINPAAPSGEEEKCGASWRPSVMLSIALIPEQRSSNSGEESSSPQQRTWLKTPWDSTSDPSPSVPLLATEAAFTLETMPLTPQSTTSPPTGSKPKLTRAPAPIKSWGSFVIYMIKRQQQKHSEKLGSCM